MNTHIKSFFNYIQYRIKENATIYFHNLKFDGEFIFYHLFNEGFTHTEDRKLKHKQFSTLIDKLGTFYSIKFRWYDKTITFLDSLKIIPFPIKDMSKAFGLEQIKGEIDYNKERGVDYIPTKEEKEYLKNDVEIAGKSLKKFFDQGLIKMTIAGNALANYRKIITKKKYERLFPLLLDDEILRKSYKGGVTLVKKGIEGKTIGRGVSLDVNSLYPYIMKEKLLPYGEPIYCEGEIKYDRFYNVGIQRLSCSFEIKKNHLPTIQIKRNMMFKSTEYLYSSSGNDVILTLTSVDLDLFFKHYNVTNIEYLEGWKFRSSNKMFKDYVNRWVEVKNKATVEGNVGMRTIAKLLLNSLYGKFGLNPVVQSKIPYFDDGLVKYKLGEQEERKSLFVPVASFITSYGRQITIEAGQNNYKRFLYCDTDSIHLKGTKIPENLFVDDVRLGAWKIEGYFKRAKYLRAKTYIEEMFINEEKTETELEIKCAGLPEKCKKAMTFNDFKTGLVIKGKLQQKRVKGGIYLADTEFTIK